MTWLKPIKTALLGLFYSFFSAGLKKIRHKNISLASFEMSWLVLLPICLITGLGVSFYGGYVLWVQADEHWEHRLEQQVSIFGSYWDKEWGAISSEIYTILPIYEQTTSPDYQKFATIMSALTQDRRILSVGFLPSGAMEGRHGVWGFPENTRNEWKLAKLAEILAKKKSDPTVENKIHLVSFEGKEFYGKTEPLNRNAFVLRVSLKSMSLPGELFILVDEGRTLKEIEKNLDEHFMSVSLFDGENQSFKLGGLSTRNIEKTFSLALPFFEKTFTAQWMASDESLGGVDRSKSLLVAIIGTLITCIVSLVLWSQSTYSRKVKGEVFERIKELEAVHRRYKLITDNSYDLIALLSLDARINYINSAYHRDLGYGATDLLDTQISKMIHPNDQESIKRAVKDVTAGKSRSEMTMRMRHKNGGWVFMEAVAQALYDDNWMVSGIILNCRDITRRKQYADQLARSEQRFRDFADSSADWLWEVNSNFEFTYVSPGIRQTMGYAPEDMIGRVKFDALFSDDNDNSRDLIENRSSRHQPYRDVEFWTASSNGERVCLRISGMPVFNERQEFIGYRGAATNITDSKLDRENMFRMATTDTLTGLKNRAMFTDELERTLSTSLRHKISGVLLFVDLDQFKSVNDTYGHDAGDELIKAVAEILERNVRTSDTVARLGGDEFGIIMNNVSLGRAKIKVQKIIDELNALKVDYNGYSLHVTMSVGMIPYPQQGRDSASLLMSADLAMYRAKDLGRNRLYIADEGLVENGKESNNSEVDERKDSLRTQLKWVERLRQALDEGDFEVHFQPIVTHDPKGTSFFEALIRLRDESGNIGAPGIFIDAAEHFGLIQKLDMSVIERCMTHFTDLKMNEGIKVTMSINLSGKTLGDPDLLGKMKCLLEKYTKVEPEYIILEVTETAALHDPKAERDMERVQEAIQELKGLGFNFALDDFGAGFSSFNYIKHLNVDIVKIDGSFILPLEHSHKDRLFVKAIADLAKGLGIKTVAEFVEDEKILHVLEELGVDYSQGYYLGKPQKNLSELSEKFKGKSVHNFLKKKES